MPRIIISLFFLICFVALAPQIHAQEINKTGIYFEGAFLGSFPLGDNHAAGVVTGGLPNAELGPGVGFQLGFGYDWTWLGIGPKFHYAWLDIDRNLPPGTFSFGDSETVDYLGIGLESRIYFIDIFSENTGRVRPYFLIGAGYAVLGNDFLDDDVLAGLEGSFGGGVQVQIVEHFYLGLETVYRPLFEENQCTFCEYIDFDVIDAALVAGVRF